LFPKLILLLFMIFDSSRGKVEKMKTLEFQQHLGEWWWKGYKQHPTWVRPPQAPQLLQVRQCNRIRKCLGGPRPSGRRRSCKSHISSSTRILSAMDTQEFWSWIANTFCLPIQWGTTLPCSSLSRWPFSGKDWLVHKTTCAVGTGRPSKYLVIHS